MSDKALYGSDTEVIPAGTSDGVLKRNIANNGWEFKTAAQLGIASTLLQTVFAEQLINTSTNSAAFTSLFSQNITIQLGSKLIIILTTSVSCSISKSQEIDFQLVIDGSPMRGFGNATKGSNVPQTGGITHVMGGLSAGLHTVDVQWRTSGGIAYIRPVGTVVEHACLMLQEVTV